MIWLLIRRLALGLPTVLQISQDYALLFHESGVCQFTDLDNHGAYDLLTSTGPGRIWALVDSNPDLEKPTGTFNTGQLFFVVQAASPRPQRVNWLQHVNSQYFYMKGWSFPEFLQAYVGRPHGHPQRSRFLQPRVSWAFCSLHRTAALVVTLLLCSTSQGDRLLRR